MSTPIPAVDTPTPVTGAAQLTEQVRAVHELRGMRDALAGLLAACQSAFDLDNADTLLRVREASAHVDAAEMALKALTLAHYTATGEKRPVAGVEVKEKTELVYDPTQAFAWAREKQMALVPESLDRRAFEKIAKATPLTFVTEKITPQAQIATDLEKALGQ